MSLVDVGIKPEQQCWHVLRICQEARAMERRTRGMLEEHGQQSTERFYKAMIMNVFGALNKMENHLL